MRGSQSLKEGRIADPSLDRRSGDDRREAYLLGYFEQGGIEKRSGVETRRKRERLLPPSFNAASFFDAALLKIA